MLMRIWTTNKNQLRCKERPKQPNCPTIILAAVCIPSAPCSTHEYSEVQPSCTTDHQYRRLSSAWIARQTNSSNETRETRRTATTSKSPQSTNFSNKASNRAAKEEDEEEALQTSHKALPILSKQVKPSFKTLPLSGTQKIPATPNYNDCF